MYKKIQSAALTIIFVILMLSQLYVEFASGMNQTPDVIDAENQMDRCRHDLRKNEPAGGHHQRKWVQQTHVPTLTAFDYYLPVKDATEQDRARASYASARKMQEVSSTWPWRLPVFLWSVCDECDQLARNLSQANSKKDIGNVDDSILLDRLRLEAVRSRAATRSHASSNIAGESGLIQNDSGKKHDSQEGLI